MRIETHIHTKYSHDSLLCFVPLCIKLIICGIKCVAITEHNNIVGALKFQAFCKKHNLKIHVIIGEEIMTDSGEIIGLYLKENIPSGLSAEETIFQIKKQDGIVYIPHPYDEKRKKTVLDESVIASNTNDIDCIECHNGRNIKKEFGIRQTEIAGKYNLTPIIGSDAHTWIEIGRNYMEFENIPKNSAEFRSEIKKAVMHKRNCIIFSHYITKLARLLKLISGGNWIELRRIINRKFKKQG